MIQLHLTLTIRFRDRGTDACFTFTFTIRVRIRGLFPIFYNYLILYIKSRHCLLAWLLSSKSKLFSLFLLTFHFFLSQFLLRITVSFMLRRFIAQSIEGAWWSLGLDLILFLTLGLVHLSEEFVLAYDKLPMRDSCMGCGIVNRCEVLVLLHLSKLVGHLLQSSLHFLNSLDILDLIWKLKFVQILLYHVLHLLFILTLILFNFAFSYKLSMSSSSADFSLTLIQ